MQRQQFLQFKGMFVCVFLKNKKQICGIVLQTLENSFKLQSDIGIIQILFKDVQFVTQKQNQKKLFVYVCKNQMLCCKGIRMISSNKKINWPCKYFKNFQCVIKKVCDYNELPLNIKQDFIDNMHSILPVHGQLKNHKK